MKSLRSDGESYLSLYSPSTLLLEGVDGRLEQLRHVRRREYAQPRLHVAGSIRQEKVRCIRVKPTREGLKLVWNAPIPRVELDPKQRDARADLEDPVWQILAEDEEVVSVGPINRTD